MSTWALPSPGGGDDFVADHNVLVPSLFGSCVVIMRYLICDLFLTATMSTPRLFL